MDDIADPVELIRTELVAWHRTPEGREFHAPAWWQGIHERLDKIKGTQGDPEVLNRANLSLEYLLLEIGPVSPTVAPSFVKHREIAGRSKP